eukprot:COSAG05_NODE_336_length_11205_cov_4.160544_8_plen_547_part_00
MANVYFLAISCLQLGTDLSPTSKYATVGPLVIIVAISAAKEAYEDLARHEDDKKANNQGAVVVGPGTQERVVPWCDVRCGQILRVAAGEHFPADLMLLRTARPDGKCHIQTAELDGETNLKIKQTQPDILDASGDPEGAFDAGNYTGHKLMYEQPNNRLYEFRGKYEFHGPNGATTVPVSNDSILLRGAMLKNTPCIHGLVIYTGTETKLSMNMTKSQPKMSDVERMVNRCIFLIFVALLVICAVSTAGAMLWVDEHRGAAYLPFLRGQKLLEQSALQFLTFLILYNNLVPISLYVTLEVVKLKLASLVSHDPKMYYAEKNMWAKARTSNIPEDLGQIQYIFSDKTGTLTRNEMEFKKASVATSNDDSDGAAYAYLPHMTPPPGFQALMAEEDLTPEIFWGLDRDSERFRCLFEYYVAISVCHTVVPELEPSGEEGGAAEVVYQAESPDEEAILLGAKAMGFHLFQTVPKHGHEYYRVRIEDEAYDFQKGEVNAFNSTRKRMSIVIRTPPMVVGGESRPAKIVLYSKGADMMMERDCNVKIPPWAR